ncbi:MAG: RDD family protein [Alphaproteobacteria bacterium]|jgi:uncharacterized RDD family membrane protein YckC|nr:RDD family protein [Alphaproteobacteria bacterium]
MWIDLIAIPVVILTPGILVSPLGIDAITASGSVIGLILALLYFPLSEHLWGRTLGKFATDLVVVREDGTNPTIWQTLIRTALRVVEVNPILLGALPAVIVVINSENHRRFGDVLAKTYVVRGRELKNLQVVGLRAEAAHA